MENEINAKTFDFGKIAFLNGQKDLHETEQDFYDFLKEHSKYEPLLLDNLFEDNEKLKLLKVNNIKSIVFGTTGVYLDKLRNLIDIFKTLNYLPDNVFFTMGELVMCGIARECKEIKPSMKFYELNSFSTDKFDFNIEEIYWI